MHSANLRFSSYFFLVFMIFWVWVFRFFSWVIVSSANELLSSKQFSSSVHSVPHSSSQHFFTWFFLLSFQKLMHQLLLLNTSVMNCNDDTSAWRHSFQCCLRQNKVCFFYKNLVNVSRCNGFRYVLAIKGWNHEFMKPVTFRNVTSLIKQTRCRF